MPGEFSQLLIFTNPWCYDENNLNGKINHYSINKVDNAMDIVA